MIFGQWSSYGISDTTLWFGYITPYVYPLQSYDPWIEDRQEYGL